MYINKTQNATNSMITLYLIAVEYARKTLALHGAYPEP